MKSWSAVDVEYKTFTLDLCQLIKTQLTNRLPMRSRVAKSPSSTKQQADGIAETTAVNNHSHFAFDPQRFQNVWGRRISRRTWRVWHRARQADQQRPQWKGTNEKRSVTEPPLARRTWEKNRHPTRKQSPQGGPEESEPWAHNQGCF